MEYSAFGYVLHLAFYSILYLTVNCFALHRRDIPPSVTG